ncbi:glycosyltransferase family 4 protein [Novosphingobium sp. M1R2S20]|uniref:Glycosyltransferase family 4 protein n=1 Tax=Novosphingobium rhizovicinum TaxID=3228928 RepID=A0ABV3RG97_9SPHN
MSASLALTVEPQSLAPELRAAPRRTVCFPFSGDAVGGSHLSVLGLLEQLDPDRYRVLIVPEIPDGRVADLFSAFEQASDPGAAPAFRPGEAFTPAKFVRALRGSGSRSKFLRRAKVDIVHLNDGRSCANWALATRLSGAKLLWHNRGNPDALGLRFAAPVLAHQVVAVSGFALPRRGIWSASNRARVVHSPFDTDLAIDRAQARRAMVDALDVAPETLIVGYVGAFVPRKRPDVFVQALARLRKTLDRPLVGAMFGEARAQVMADRLRDQITSHNAGSWIGQMGYREPGAFWIAGCDILLVPAVDEPFGRTLVEAMLVGTPVVAARSGGNIEALDGGLGLLADPDDADALASACARLVHEPDLATNIAVRAQTYARDHYSRETHLSRICAVYDEMLA